MYLKAKVPRSVKLKAAKAVSEYALERWQKKNQSFGIPVDSDNGIKSLKDILSPHIGEMPPMESPIRTYWISAKYEIIRLAYLDYLKSRQLWVQSLPYYGIHVRDKPQIRETTRLVNNIRRLVNHALELDAESEIDDFMPLELREQLKMNRDLQLQVFLGIKDQMECNPDLELDEDTRKLFGKLKIKVLKHLEI